MLKISHVLWAEYRTCYDVLNFLHQWDFPHLFFFLSHILDLCSEVMLFHPTALSIRLDPLPKIFCLLCRPKSDSPFSVNVNITFSLNLTHLIRLNSIVIGNLSTSGSPMLFIYFCISHHFLSLPLHWDSHQGSILAGFSIQFSPPVPGTLPKSLSCCHSIAKLCLTSQPHGARQSPCPSLSSGICTH